METFISDQLMTLFPPAEWIHVAALPVKQASSALTIISEHSGAASSSLVFVRFEHLVSADFQREGVPLQPRTQSLSRIVMT